MTAAHPTANPVANSWLSSLRSGALLAFVVLQAAFGPAGPQAALAQAGGSSSLFSTTPSLGAFSPPPARGGDGFGGGALGPATQAPVGIPQGAAPMVPAGQVALSLTARFGAQSSPINGGLTWRVYAAKTEKSGGYRMIREDKSASPTIVLPAGNYIVHVG